MVEHCCVEVKTCVQTISQNCVVITVHKTLFYALMQMLWSSRTLDNVTCNIWHLTSYCQWSYNNLWSQNIWWIQHPLTTQYLRVEWNMSHIMRAKHFIGSFADIWRWYLVPTDTAEYCGQGVGHTGNRNWCVVRWAKRFKINWIGLWIRSCCQSKRQAGSFQSWIALK